MCYAVKAITIALAFVYGCFSTISIHAEKDQRTTQLTDNFVNVSYVFNNLTITSSPEQGNCASFELDGFSHYMREGHPDLLKRIETFLIPDGMKVGNIEIEEVVDTLDIKCLPSILPYIDGETSTRENEITISGIWPSQSASTLPTGIYRGNRIGKIMISPLRYDIENEKVYFSKKLNVKLNFTEDTGFNQHCCGISSDMLSTLLTINDIQGIETYALKPIETPVGGEHLLILTTDEFKNEVGDFALWKKRLGYNAEVLVISEHEAQSPEQIKQIIQDRYNESDNLEYVLIIGSGEIIKPFKGRLNVKYDNEIVEYYTDFPYSCMDGEDDCIPDLYIGRIPAKNIEELQVMLTKSIYYESLPPYYDNSFYRTGTHLAEFDCPFNKYGNLVNSIYKKYDYSRFIWTSEFVKTAMENLGYDINRIYYAHPITNPQYFDTTNKMPNELLKPNYNWNMTADDVVEAINNHTNYLFVRGHANYTTWTNLGFKKEHVDSLKNASHMPIVFSVSCQSGSFYDPKDPTKHSLAQDLLRSSIGGSPAIIGASQLSWSPPNDYFAAGLFEAIYPHSLVPNFYVDRYGKFNQTERMPVAEIGKILQLGMSRMFEVFEDSAPYSLQAKVNQEIYHCLGDPTLKFNRTKPIKKTPIYTEDNGRMKLSDDRTLVMVNKQTGAVFLDNSNNWDNIDELIEKYYLSLIGDGYVPELLNADNIYYSIPTKPQIQNVKKTADGLEINYTHTNSNMSVVCTDIYGTCIQRKPASDGYVIINNPNAISIIMLEADGIVVDSKYVMSN